MASALGDSCGTNLVACQSEQLIAERRIGHDCIGQNIQGRVSVDRRPRRPRTLRSVSPADKQNGRGQDETVDAYEDVAIIRLHEPELDGVPERRRHGIDGMTSVARLPLVPILALIGVKPTEAALVVPQANKRTDGHDAGLASPIPDGKHASAPGAVRLSDGDCAWHGVLFTERKVLGHLYEGSRFVLGGACLVDLFERHASRAHHGQEITEYPMGRKSKFAPEVRERAVGLVREKRQSHESEWAAIVSVAESFFARILQLESQSPRSNETAQPVR